MGVIETVFFGWFGERVFDGFFFARGSNYGERIDVVAPGTDIYSTLPKNKYGNKTGNFNGSSACVWYCNNVFCCESEVYLAHK